jgi:hypothetical protein
VHHHPAITRSLADASTQDRLSQAAAARRAARPRPVRRPALARGLVAVAATVATALRLTAAPDA